MSVVAHIHRILQRTVMNSILKYLSTGYFFLKAIKPATHSALAFANSNFITLTKLFIFACWHFIGSYNVHEWLNNGANCMDNTRK